MAESSSSLPVTAQKGSTDGGTSARSRMCQSFFSVSQGATCSSRQKTAARPVAADASLKLLCRPTSAETAPDVAAREGPIPDVVVPRQHHPLALPRAPPKHPDVVTHVVHVIDEHLEQRDKHEQRREG